MQIRNCADRRINDDRGVYDATESVFSVFTVSAADAIRETFMASAMWEQRAEVALQSDLSRELIAKLVLNDNENVRHML